MRVMSAGGQRVPHNQNGFTMIEVLVAMIILAIGLLGVAGVQVLSLKQISNSNVRSVVNMHAYDLSERLRAESSHLGDYEKVLSATCAGCNTDLANWHNELLEMVPTASTKVDITELASRTTAEIQVNWTERDFGNDAAAQSYTLFVRLR